MFVAKMLKVFVFFLILAVSVNSAGNQNTWGNSNTNDQTPKFVENVVQDFEEEINKKLVTQIERELQASHLYRAYASYYQRADVALPGIHKFFLKASDEEKDHAHKLIDYVNKRGGHVTLSDVNLQQACKVVMDFHQKEYKSVTPLMCICGFVTFKTSNTDCAKTKREQWKNGLYGFEDALATELFINSKLLKLHKFADEKGNAHLLHFLEDEFLEEQVQSINQLGHFVARLKSFSDNSYSLGEYIFDQRLE